MNNQEFDKLVATASEEMGVPASLILDKHSVKGAKARRFVCHTVYYGLNHLRKVCLERLQYKNEAFYNSVRRADEEIHTNVDSLVMLNEIRTAFHLLPLKHAVKFRPKIPHTKTLFGFTYSEHDATRFRRACRASKEYMDKLCSNGYNPTSY